MVIEDDQLEGVSITMSQPMRVVQFTLADRILAVLAESDIEMSAKAIHAAIQADEHPKVSHTTVETEVIRLKGLGTVAWNGKGGGHTRYSL